MQTDYKQVNKITAKRTGKSEQTYKDIQTFIFSEVHSLLRRPESLILKLRGVGTWYLRKKRMQSIVDKYPERLIEKTREEFSTDKEFNDYQFKRETYLNFITRLAEYEHYIKLRDQIRLKRYENQALLEPTKGQDGRYQSGKD